jgi:site-specific recombinase XerD
MQTVDNFLDSLKSERTKEQYAYHLKRFNRYQSVSDRVTDTRIVNYLVQMKKEGLSSSYRNIALAAVKHYYTMNDVVLNWKKIAKFIGEPKFDNQIRGYNHEEIQKLLFVADVKYKCVILTLCSTGMRREALVQINPLKDMEYLNDHQLYKIRIYRNTKWEQICFTTPEAANAINLHMQTRNRRYFHDVHPQALSDRIRDLAVKAGLGKLHPLTETSRHGVYRNDIPAVHGLRKFTITQMAKAKVDTEIAKLLTGHTIGVRGRYLNYSEDDLLEEYLKAVDNLTINEENRLKLEVKGLEDKNTEIESLKAKINSMQQTQDQFTELSKKLYEAGILKKD